MLSPFMKSELRAIPSPSDAAYERRGVPVFFWEGSARRKDGTCDVKDPLDMHFERGRMRLILNLYMVRVSLAA